MGTYDCEFCQGTLQIISIKFEEDARAHSGENLIEAFQLAVYKNMEEKRWFTHG